MTLAPRTDFIGLEDCIHLAAGGEPPLLREVSDAFHRFATDKSQGRSGRRHFFDVADEARQLLSGRVGLQADDIAFLGSCSEATNLVCWSLPWEAGDNVVINDLDYPSMIYPFCQLRERYGVEVRLVKSSNFAISTADIARQIDDRTRLICVSHVSYLTGLRNDIGALADLAHKKNAAVLTDVSHSLGVIPVDLSNIDFAVSCTYKWVLGIHGVGVFFWNRRLQPAFEPLYVGEASVLEHPPISDVTRLTLRQDATRAVVGNSSWIGLYALVKGLRYLKNLGEEEVYAHVMSLRRQCLEGLKDLGYSVSTPEEAGQSGASVSFQSRDWQQLWDLLESKKILVWAGNGRVRVSPFVYNHRDDIDLLLSFLRSLKSPPSRG